MQGIIPYLLFRTVIMNKVVEMHHASIGRLGPSMGEEIEIGALRTEESQSNPTLLGCHKVYEITSYVDLN